MIIIVRVKEKIREFFAKIFPKEVYYINGNDTLPPPLPQEIEEEMIEKIIDAVPAAAGKFFEENSELFKAIISSKKLSIAQ